MKNKEWYKSKTVWTALAGFVLAVLLSMGIAIPAWIYSILMSFGLYSLRDAHGLKY